MEYSSRLEMVPVEKLVPYINNARIHGREQIASIRASFREFGFLNPILIDEDCNVIAGHGRLLAAMEECLEEVPCILERHLTAAQRKAYILADNRLAELAEWDPELLKVELEGLKELDFDTDLLGFDEIPEMNVRNPESQGSLQKQFLVPPFSVFDLKQEYWKERKRMWEEKGLESWDGREGDITFSRSLEKYGKNLHSVSIFHPGVCEVMYRWFCPEGGTVYDCFAGGSVRGIVAEMLGRHYTGIDLREEQVEANRENAERMGVSPVWICGDSLEADRWIGDGTVDFLFSCPPYADLEVYSDDERDLSNMDYGKFCEVYGKIIDISCRKLKEDRFAAFVVGDVRDKVGAYRNLVDYTKQCFNRNGLATWNEIIMLDSLGTSMIRCAKPFNVSRKVTKVHQNVLVFYKGDAGKIRENFGTVINEEETLEFTEEL